MSPVTGQAENRLSEWFRSYPRFTVTLIIGRRESCPGNWIRPRVNRTVSNYRRQMGRRRVRTVYEYIDNWRGRSASPILDFCRQILGRSAIWFWLGTL